MVWFLYFTRQRDLNRSAGALRKQSCGLFLATGAAAAARCGFAEQKRVKSLILRQIQKPDFYGLVFVFYKAEGFEPFGRSVKKGQCHEILTVTLPLLFITF